MWICKNKLLFKVIFSSLLLIFLISCSSDSEEKNVDQFTNTSEKNSSENNKNNESETSTKKTNKNIEFADKQLNVLYADPPTLDPHRAQDSTSAGIILEIYSGLVSLDTNLQIIPDIAKSWTISNDGMKYTFKLRDNAKFHNGKKITAEDFIWSFNRAANPATTSITAEDYLGDIVGVKEVIDGKTDKISGIKLINELTIEINIDSPKAYFLAKLTYPVSFVLDSENVKNKNWTDSPNGSGPFMLDEYLIGEKLLLKIYLNS